MAVNDHPLYADWVKASDHLNEAIARHHLAKKSGKEGLIKWAKIDMDKAQEAYEKIASQV